MALEEGDTCSQCKWAIENHFEKNNKTIYYYTCWARPPQFYYFNDRGLPIAKFPSVNELSCCSLFDDSEILQDPCCFNCEYSIEGILFTYCGKEEKARVWDNHVCSFWSQQGQGLKSDRARELEEASGMLDVPF